MTYHFSSGRALTNIMRARGDSLSTLAQKLEVKRQQVHRWKYTDDLKLSVALKICRVYNITIKDFVKMGELTDAEMDNKSPV